MKKILFLAWNDIKIEFSERSTLLFFFILPLVFTAILGVSFGGDGDPNSDYRFLVPVVDLDNSDYSKVLIEGFGNSNVIRPGIFTLEEAETLLNDGEVVSILVIPSGFEKKTLSGNSVEIELIQSPSSPNVLAIEQAIYSAIGKVSNVVTAAAQSVNSIEHLVGFQSKSAKRLFFNSSLKIAKDVMSDPIAESQVTQAIQTPSTGFNAFELSSAGQLVTWTLITLLGASEVFVSERVGGTLSRLLSTPSTKAAILSGKITGRFVMGLLQMVVLITSGAIIFNVNWGTSPAALSMVVVAFGLSAVALGVMLGAFAKLGFQASNLTVMFSMVMAALGGAWWQMEITPPLYQKMVQILPSTWAMKGFNQVLVQGGGPTDVLIPVTVLLGFAVVFFFVGVRKLKFE